MSVVPLVKRVMRYWASGERVRQINPPVVYRIGKGKPPLFELH